MNLKISMTSDALTDDKLMSVVMYDIENIIMRYRRLFNFQCYHHSSVYESEDYRKIQKLFDQIENECIGIIFDCVFAKPFMFVFNDPQYVYINRNIVTTCDELNSLLFDMNMNMKELEVQYLMFYDWRGNFAENSSDVQAVIERVADKVMNLVKNKSKAHMLETVTQKLDELDYLLSGF